MMGFLNSQNVTENNEYSNRDQLHTIPVVFHVVHLGEEIGTGTNISDEQILDGLRVLNEDFRKIANTNGDGNGVDVEIEFCLAQRDTNDAPTTGINRVDGSIWPEYLEYGIRSAPFFNGYSEVSLKSATSWDRSSYLNIWVVSEINNNNASGGTLGYAFFPTDMIQDGIVILHNVIGTFGNVTPNYNQGRVLTHEVGHYLGLFHTFGMYSDCEDAFSETNCSSQGDQICDTPPTSENFSCAIPNCEGAQIENYMDYTQQECKNMFTQGQKDRMRGSFGILHPFRITLLDSDACIPVDGFNIALTNPNVIRWCGSSDLTPQIEVLNLGTVEVNNFTILSTIEGSEYMVQKDCVLTTPLQPNEHILIDFPTSAVGYGNYMVNFELLTEDIYSGDNTISYSVSNQPSQEIGFSIYPDAFSNETSWVLKNSSDSVIYEVDMFTYPNGNFGIEYQYYFCLPNDCYSFTIYDNCGDGMAFGPGSYQFTYGEEVLVSHTSQFVLCGGCIGQASYTGPNETCWDERFEVFCLENAGTGQSCEDLNENDVCDFDDVYGCTDSSANNFNSNANVDDGSCTYNIYGCTDPSANNYNPNANIEDGSCTYNIYGCTDPLATNYDPSANMDDGSCLYVSVEEAIRDEVKLIKTIKILDISGRVINIGQYTSSGLYILFIQYEDGTYDTKKISMN